MYTIETENWIYEVVNWQRKDYLYNVYVHKTSKLSNTYVGEAVYTIGVKEPIEDLDRKSVVILNYELNN